MVKVKHYDSQSKVRSGTSAAARNNDPAIHGNDKPFPLPLPPLLTDKTLVGVDVGIAVFDVLIGGVTTGAAVILGVIIVGFTVGELTSGVAGIAITFGGVDMGFVVFGVLTAGIARAIILGGVAIIAVVFGMLPPSDAAGAVPLGDVDVNVVVFDVLPWDIVGAVPLGGVDVDIVVFSVLASGATGAMPFSNVDVFVAVVFGVLTAGADGIVPLVVPFPMSVAPALSRKATSTLRKKLTGTINVGCGNI